MDEEIKKALEFLVADICKYACVDNTYPINGNLLARAAKALNARIYEGKLIALETNEKNQTKK